MAEQTRTVRPTDNWPATRGHDELHPVPGAVPANRGARCPDCGAPLWDRNNEAGGPHTAEVCEWNQAHTARREAEAGRRPRVGPGAPDLLTVDL